MSKTARDGSYGMSLGAGAGSAICLALTGWILHAFGKMTGANAEAQQIFSWANVAVHVLGFVLMGLALGYFLNKRSRNWLWAAPCAILLLSTAGYTWTNLYGFASAQRITATKAIEDQKKRIADKASERATRSKERQQAQERLAGSQLRFMQAEVKDASGKAKRQLTKDFAKNTAEIIAEIGKETVAAPDTKVEAEVDADVGAQELAKIAGMTTEMVQVGLAMWLAKLFVALEMLLWPMASFTWPRKTVQAAPPVAKGEVQDPDPLPAPPASKPLMIEHRPAPPDPAKASVLLRRAHLPEAAASLEAIDFPLRNLSGPLRDKEHFETSAERFLAWIQACGLCQEATPKDEVAGLYLEFCVADHREPAAWNVVSGHLRTLRPVYFGKLTQRDGTRQHRYTIKPGKYPKPSPQQAASDHKQEGGTVVAFDRPLAEAPAHDDVSAEPTDQPVHVDEIAKRRQVQFDHPVLNAARAHWMRRDARHMHRKQRGSRSGRRAA